MLTFLFMLCDLCQVFYTQNVVACNLVANRMLDGPV